MIDVYSAIEDYINEEGEAPEGLSDFVVQSHDAMRTAGQHSVGWGGHGGRQLRERVMRVASLCAPDGGDLAQIGHGGGYVTGGLAAVAQKHNCRIVAVDTGAGSDEHRSLEQVTLPWRDAKLRKSEERMLRLLPNREQLIHFNFCFALISGKGNDFFTYLNDILRFPSCRVIAVDYCFCPSGPRLAFEVAAVLLERVAVRNEHCREGYLVQP